MADKALNDAIRDAVQNGLSEVASERGSLVNGFVVLVDFVGDEDCMWTVASEGLSRMMCAGMLHVALFEPMDSPVEE